MFFNDFFRHDLVGADEIQRAQAEEIVDAINEIMDHLFAVIVPNDPKERKEKNEEAIEIFRNSMASLVFSIALDDSNRFKNRYFMLEVVYFLP